MVTTCKIKETFQLTQQDSTIAHLKVVMSLPTVSRTHPICFKNKYNENFVNASDLRTEYFVYRMALNLLDKQQYLSELTN